MILVFEKSIGFGNLEYRNIATRNGRGRQGDPEFTFNRYIIHV